MEGKDVLSVVKKIKQAKEDKERINRFNSNRDWSPSSSARTSAHARIYRVQHHGFESVQIVT